MKTLTRGFEVAPPAVLMASAEGAGGRKSADADCSCRSATNCSRVRSAATDALKLETLDAFRARLAPSAKPSFETGVAFLTSGDYAKAETT